MLEVKDLEIEFEEEGVRIIKGINFNVADGEIVGLVGESGSGKSMTSLAIAGLSSSKATEKGSITLDGEQILGLSRQQRQKIMGSQISMVFQEPMSSLNPVIKVGKQLREMLVLHDAAGLSKAQMKERVYEALDEVGLDAADIYGKYPYEMSGGQQQRVMIAMALMCSPKLLLCDEPTTALDADVQEQIIDLLLALNRTKKVSILFISHDLRLVARMCHRIEVMYQGEIVEKLDDMQVLRLENFFKGGDELSLAEMFESVGIKDDYTKRLISSACLEKKKALANAVQPVLEVKNLSVFYKTKEKGFFGRKQKRYVCQNLSFNVGKGEIVGLIGESGSGKSSISRTILGLHKDYTGEIIHHTKMPQMVFQDILSSLNPSYKIGWSLEEPLRVNGVRSAEARRRIAAEVMKEVGLSEELLDRYPKDLSGGQRQRVNIGIALILGMTEQGRRDGYASFIIADEAVSALDVTVQAQILDLLLKLQKEYGLSILFISHDPRVVNRVCDRVIKL